MPSSIQGSIDIEAPHKDVERDLITLRHSATVAKAARLIAARISGMDEDEAARWGYFHDVGKLYISRGRPYQHLRKGYEILKKDEKTRLPLVCLLHPFPDLTNADFIHFFFRGDEAEHEAWTQALATFPEAEFKDENILLIQLCDKLSGVDSFVTLEEKFDWYAKGTPPQPFIFAQKEAYQRLKERFDQAAHADVYHILGIAG